MDTRTGRIYESEAAAREAGAVDVARVDVTGETVRVDNGPFKGRVYERTQDLEGRITRGRRRRDLEEKLTGELS